jgi:bifunctional UDP-N-acetylglucosamine pyrophosphorylase/glucosamine-1-phosphate N-acetyltransferase
VLDNLQAAGVQKVHMVVNYKKETIINYFSANPCGMEMNFITQGEKYGTAAAFLEANGHVSGTFFGMAGDIITEDAALKRLAKGHDGEVSACLARMADAGEYGTAIVEGGKIASFEEKAKSPKSDLVNCSIYAFEPSIFERLAKVKQSSRGEYEVTDVLLGATAVEISDYWLDMGMPWQLFAANEFLLSKMPEKRAGQIDNSTVKGKLIMEKGAVIHDSYIEGTVYIGENTRVGPHAYIRGTSSIGANCDIGDSTTVKNSIIFDRVNAKHLAYIGDSIIGENCNFGAATQIANYRFDALSIKAKVNDVVIDTRRNKLGAIIGDGTKMGVLSCVMPERIIGDGCWVSAGVVVEENIERKTHVILKQNLQMKKLDD